MPICVFQFVKFSYSFGDKRQSIDTAQLNFSIIHLPLVFFSQSNGGMYGCIQPNLKTKVCLKIAQKFRISMYRKAFKSLVQSEALSFAV